MSEASAPQGDVFERLVAEDEGWIRSQWEAIATELREVDSAQRELNIRRERLEAQRSVLDGIARLRRLDLDQLGVDDGLAPAMRTPRDLALEIMRAGEQEWTAPLLHEALEAEGLETSRSNVRMVLRRLVEDGTVKHVARGRYRATAPFGGPAAHAEPDVPVPAATE